MSDPFNHLLPDWLRPTLAEVNGLRRKVEDLREKLDAVRAARDTLQRAVITLTAERDELAATVDALIADLQMDRDDLHCVLRRASKEAP